MSFTVLIVDDSSTMRKVIKRSIEMSGFDVGAFFEGSNGHEALAILEKEWVDIILTDIHMPVMDGVTFLKALQKKPLVSATPVVIVTTEGRDHRLEEILSLGARACIRKPFKPEEIRDILMQVLSIKEVPEKEKEGLNGCDF